MSAITQLPQETTTDLDALLSLPEEVSAIAELAFGSLNLSRESLAQSRHLALVPAEALKLDLSDPGQRRFGNYELLELIGEGGMGVVYRAHQNGLDRDVAVKLLAAGPWASRKFIERFRHEAQHAARMQHPNIVAIYEVGAVEELQFFSMRLVRGSSLAGLLRREGKLEPMHAAKLLCTIAEAVDYAHRLGVLHLDLKPANVLLDESGVPHVADFGLARRLEHGFFAADNDEISGTPSYMAPEQCITGAQKITPATDIWGLGAIGYELVTGAPPFLGDSPLTTIKQVVDSRLRDPRELAPALPRDLAAIIAKCMTRSVSERYASARELADDLTRFLESREVRARPLNLVQRQWRWACREPRLAAAMLIALIALIAGLAATTEQWRRANANARRAETNAAESHELLWQGRRDLALRLQADGKGFQALPALVANIAEREKAGADAGVERREVGMILSQSATLIDRMIIADAKPLAVAVSPDGSLLAIGLDDISVRWYDTATLTERGRLDLLDQPTSDGAPRAPRLLRFVDNHRLRVTLDWLDYLTSPADIDTIMIDLDHARAIAPPPAFADFASADYSANGRHALLFNHANGVQLWQVEPWRPLSAIMQSADGKNIMPWLLSDDGRHALHSSNDGKGLAVVDVQQHSSRNIEVMNGRRTVTWAISHDGKLLAVGDEYGRVHLIDIATGKLRTLALPSGSNAAAIAFSEDDAWVAVARIEGDAYAFDVASGNTLHSGLMQHDFEPHHVALSHRANLLIVSGAGDVALWHMPEQGPSGGSAPALRIANPTGAERAGMDWAGASFEAGLLATADMDGEVRLWRLPIDPVVHALAARSASNVLRFDGRHVIDVEHDRLRVIGIDGRSATGWLPLPPPIVFAELVDSAKSLVVVCGRELRMYDSATLQPRYAPVVLPDTPNNFALSPDDARAVLAFGHNTQAGFELHLQAFDLATGKQRSGEATVQGPIRWIDFSANGQRLFVAGPANGATDVFDAATLRRIGQYPHAPDAPVIAAAFAPDGATLWLVEAGSDEAEAGRLVHWDPQAGRVLEQRQLTGDPPIGLSMLGGKPLVFTRSRFVLDPGGAGEKIGPRLRGGEMTNVLAVTADRRVMAHAWGRNIQLYDTATLQAIGQPLRLDWDADDNVLQLAFDPSGAHLLARLDASNRLIAWPVPSDSRSSEALQRVADLLATTPRVSRVLRMADAAERTNLRARDPGAWPPQEVRAARRVDALLPRDRRAGPMQLDLTRFYRTMQTAKRDHVDMVLIGGATFPVGLATLDGVDYDIRGIVELRAPRVGSADARATDAQPRAAGIKVPPVPIAALHVLLYASLALPEPDEREYADVRLHYVDGSEAVLPIRTQREVPGMTANDKPTPIGWGLNELASIGMLPVMAFSNPRLANPHPEKIIASLDLEAPTSGWSAPAFIAITAEPVIPAGKSRNQSGVDDKH